MRFNKSIVIKCAIALSLVIATVTAVVAYAAADSLNTVTINDNGKTSEFKTYGNTVDEILNDVGLIPADIDEVTATLSANEKIITINRGFKVHVTMNNDEFDITSTKNTVSEILKSAGIVLGEHDVCNKDMNEVLTGESYIDIVCVDYKTVSYNETIPFSTITGYSDKIPAGEKKITGGVEGVKTVTLTQKVENGKTVSSNIVSSVVTKNPVDKRIIIGTKGNKKESKINSYNAIQTISVLTPSVDFAMTQKGIPASYKKFRTARATAYTSASGRCATGVKPKPGYIAVNPKVIPYGTRMFIRSKDGKYIYGYAIAADTGGFIKKHPTGVDLYFSTEQECRNFGVREVEIYILN